MQQRTEKYYSVCLIVILKKRYQLYAGTNIFAVTGFLMKSNKQLTNKKKSLALKVNEM